MLRHASGYKLANDGIDMRAAGLPGASQYPEYDPLHGSRAGSLSRASGGTDATRQRMLLAGEAARRGATARTVRRGPLSCEKARKTRIFMPIWDSSGESLVETAVASTQ